MPKSTASKTWAASVSGDFADPSKWTPAGVPGSSDTVAISSKGAYSVTSSANETMQTLVMAKGPTLAIEDDVFAVTGGTGSGALAGAITLALNSVLDLGAASTSKTFNYSGTTAITAGFMLISGDVTLAGNGKGAVTMAEASDTNATIEGNTADAAFNNSTKISGEGFISAMTLDNQVKGVIDGNGADPDNGLVIGTGNTVTNAGILEGTTASGLVLFDPVSNSGQIEALGSDGRVALTGDVTNTGTKAAVKAAAAGAVVEIEGIIISGGSVSTVKGSTLETLLGEGPSIITDAKATNAGTIDTQGSDLTIDGALTNSGMLLAYNHFLKITGAVKGSGTATIQGSGTLEFGSTAAPKQVSFAAGATGQLILDDPAGFKGTIGGLSTPQGSFNNMLGFGDSSIDSGWFATALKNNLTADETGNAGKNQLIENAVNAGGSGTGVGVGPMNSQLLASDLGLSMLPEDTPGGAGTNYAIAGAYDNADANNGNAGNANNNSSLPSTVQQIANYLSAHGGSADANALFLISSGGNDITYAQDNYVGLAAQENFLQGQIDGLASEIATLQSDGGAHILVLDNYGNGTLNTYYDAQLASMLNTDGVNYIDGDVQSLVNYIKANPTAFGLSTVAPGTVGSGNSTSALDTETGASATTSGWGQWGAPSTTPTSSFAYLRAPNAQFTSLYSDNQHLSTVGQEIEANYELTLLYEAGLLSVDTIDLKTIPYSFPTSDSSPPPTTASFTGTTTGGTLTVTDHEGHTATIKLSGDYQGVSFTTASDGASGTVVFDPPVASDIAADLAGSPLADGRYGNAITVGTDLGVVDFTIARDVTLAGDGTIALTVEDNIISDGSAVTLTNDETVAGGGVIGDRYLKLVNAVDAIIDADSTTDGMVIQASGGVSNAGTIEASDGGWLVIQQTTVANAGAGSVEAVGAGTILDLEGAIIAGGAVSVGAGATIDTVNNQASTIKHAVVTNAGTLAASYGDLTIDAGVTNAGNLAAANGSRLDITGTVAGAGTATIGSGGIVEFGGASDANVTFLDATGTLQLDHAFDNASRFSGTVAGFAAGADAIDLGAIDAAKVQVSFTENSDNTAGTLAVSGDRHTTNIVLLGNYLAASFVTASDGHGGTVVTSAEPDVHQVLASSQA